MLIERKANVNVQRNDGRTSLMIAAESNSLDVCGLLMKANGTVCVVCVKCG